MNEINHSKNRQIFSVHPNILAFEKNICNFSIEEGERVGIFSQDGDLLKEVIGELNENLELLSLIEEKYRFEFEDTILTHNHPSNTSFNKRDLVSASELHLYEIRVVGQTGLFSMKPMEKKWPLPNAIGKCYDAVDSDPEFQSKLNDIEFDPNFIDNSQDIYIDMLRIRSVLRCKMLATRLNLCFQNADWADE